MVSRHRRDGRARLFGLEHRGALLLVAEPAAGKALDARVVDSMTICQALVRLFVLSTSPSTTLAD